MTPLAGQRPGNDGNDDDGKDSGAGKGPARGYSWPPFEPGNAAALRHGAHSERVVVPRATQILTALLEDPAMPDHVRSPAFRYQAVAWARAEAVAELLHDYVDGMTAEQMISPRLPGTKAPVDVWRTADAHAARLRSHLGLDPVGYARVVRDVGLGARAQEDALRALDRTGAEIIARRAALEAGPAT